MSEPIIHLRGVSRYFDSGRLKALDSVDLDVAEGEFVAICGPSGCGKSTLLHLIAALERPDEGTIIVAGHDLAREQQLTKFRARDVGIVFQLDNLLPSLTASENVQVPMIGQELSVRERVRRADEILAGVGLQGRAHERPSRLSGGERQRVAIARALANQPKVLLADEPTGRLDSESGRRVLELLQRIRKERGISIVLVTHDAGVAAQADHVVHMLDGRILPDHEVPPSAEGVTAAEKA